MGGVGTSILGRPRPLPGHRRAAPLHPQLRRAGELDHPQLVRRGRGEPTFDQILGGGAAGAGPWWGPSWRRAPRRPAFLGHQLLHGAPGHRRWPSLAQLAPHLAGTIDPRLRLCPPAPRSATRRREPPAYDAGRFSGPSRSRGDLDAVLGEHPADRLALLAARGVDGVRRGARAAARTSGTSLTGQAEEGPLRQIILELRLPRTVSAIVVGAALGVAGRAAAGRARQPARLAGRDRRHRRRGLRRDAHPAGVAERDRAAAGRRARLRRCSRRRSSSRSAGRARTPASIGRVILAGIAITALFGAATTSLMVAYSDRVQSAIFWLAGGLSSEGWSLAARSSGRTSRSASCWRCSSRGRWTGSRWATTSPPRSAAARGACGSPRPARRRCWRPARPRSPACSGSSAS